MIAARCLCGFTAQGDETLEDHLLSVFAPQNAVGADGQFHDETTQCACVCGFTAPAPDGLDAHFLAAFTPADRIGDDGQEHGIPESLPGAR
ncbi:MAG TPA: hypothetical protein VH478_09665 [Trebonia sp.]|jgi:hypothetical protein|nr:hypothetical protein [Trebonia sp.]